MKESPNAEDQEENNLDNEDQEDSEEVEEIPFLKRLDEFLEDGEYFKPGKLLIKEVPKDQIEYVTDIAHLGPGCAFGENSLMYTKSRPASIKVIERCHLVTINKKDFNKAFNEIDRKRMADKVNFIKELPVF